jgi:tetratricopeptide (TPR) repeat protein
MKRTWLMRHAHWPIIVMLAVLVAPSGARAQEKPKERSVVSYLKGVLRESENDYQNAYQYFLYAASQDPDDRYLTLKLARTALEIGDLDHAREYATKLRSVPEYADDAGMILAEADYKLGDTDDALRILNELRSRPNLPRVSILKFLAKIYLDRKDLANARAALEEASALPEADVTVLYELGVLSAEAGKNARASELLQRALEMDPDFPEAELALGELFEQDGKRDEAKRAFRETLRLDPDNRTAVKELTDMLYADGQFAEGVAVLEPLHSAGKLDEGGEIVYGRFLYKAEKTDQALAVFNALMKKSGETPGLLRVISEMEVERGDLKSAIAHLRRLIILEPNRFANYVGLLLIAGGLGGKPSSPAEAVTLSDEEREQYIQQARAHVDRSSEDDNYIMGSVMRKAGHPEEAERYLVRAEQISPEKSSTLLELATVYNVLGKYDDALRRVVAVYREQPEDPTVANFYGYLLAEKGDSLQRAEELIRKALVKEPDNGYFLDSLGWVKFKMGRYEEALKILLDASAKAKDDAVIWEHIGDTYSKLDDSRKAIAAYGKSLSADPKNAGVSEKMKKLEAGGGLGK